MCDARKFGIRIGYALSPRRSQCLIKQSLLDHANNQGIQLVEIHAIESLSQQGPFDAIIHKLYDEKWNQKLHDFSSKNPEVVIVDSPCAVERLHSRISMLEAVGKMKNNNNSREEKSKDGLVNIPEQVVVHHAELLSDLSAFKDLEFPVIAKPILANASANSHKLSLVFNNNGLKELEAPIILQQFINHGGVIFKVYVAGKYVKCVLRNSLPDIILDEKPNDNSENLLTFSHISNLCPDDENKLVEADMPTMIFVEEVAQGMRQALNLNLFNFDLIRNSGDKDGYFVIDINYFPWYEKLPSYESFLTDFFKDILIYNHETRKACTAIADIRGREPLQFAKGGEQEDSITDIDSTSSVATTIIPSLSNNI